MKKLFVFCCICLLAISSGAQTPTKKPEAKTLPAKTGTAKATAPNPAVRTDTTVIRSDSLPSRPDTTAIRLLPPPEANPTAAESAPEVIITGHEVKGMVDSTVIRTAIDHYYQTRIEGFQQSGLPRFIITGRERKFLLGIGGFVNFRASFDFGGAIDNRDFVTYDIPVPGNRGNRQRFGMDAASSRIFFKAIANSNSLGQVSSYIEIDFRGTTSNLMRMRYAYISFWGLLFGRSVTTFCDLGASPTTVDTEGPSAYTFNFNEMVRWSHTFPDKRWSFAVSAETPAASTTLGGNLTPAMQRMPDVPAYIQYEWGGEAKRSHLRFSTIIRELRYYDADTDQAHSRAGWGVQLSGAVKLPDKFTFFAQLAGGRGIARYIQDIAGVGLDLVPSPTNPDRMDALPMGGYFAALEYRLSKKMFLCAGYSRVDIYRASSYPANDDYRNAHYYFSNLFINIGSSCTLGAEYTFGRRINTDGSQGHANRIQAMIQYNF